MDKPSVLENLPDKVLKIALKIIKPHYTGNPDVDLDNTNFISSCDDVVKLTGLSGEDYGETPDYSFLHQLMKLKSRFRFIRIVRENLHLITSNLNGRLWKESRK